MNWIVESKRAQVMDLCRQHRVRRLESFGSATRADFDEAHSDIDFLVERDDDPSVSPLDAYFGLKDALEAMFGRPVDLVSMGSPVNPYVMATIERDRQLVYAA